MAVSAEERSRALARLPPQVQETVKTPQGEKGFERSLADMDLLYAEAKRRGLDRAPSIREQVDELERRLCIQTTVEGTSAAQTTSYLWGPQAKLRQATLPTGDSFGYGYDLDRRLNQINGPPVAAGIAGYQAMNQSFTLDYLGRIVTRTRGNAVSATWVTTYTNGLGQTLDPNLDTQQTMLDARGRVSFQKFMPGPSSVSGMMTVGMSYDGQDQRTAMSEVQASNHNYNTVYVYDGRARLTSESRVGAAGAAAVQFAYVPTSDEVQTVTSPAGQTTYTYDPVFERIQQAGLTSVGWEAGGQRIQKLGGAYADEVRCYDGRGRTAGIIHGATGTVACGATPSASSLIAQFGYQYDDRDNRIGEAYADPYVNEGTTYDYDSDDRLTGVVYPTQVGAFYQLAGDGTRTAELQILNPLPSSFDYASASGTGETHNYQYQHDAYGGMQAINELVPPPDGGASVPVTVASYTTDAAGRC